MKNIHTITALITLFIFSSCKEVSSNHEETKQEVIPVKVANASGNNDHSFIATSGKVVAGNSANITTRVMGYVQKTHVITGAKVIKGQLLLEINNKGLQAKKLQAKANVTQAEAVFNNAKKDLKRFEQLFKESSASQKELENVTVQYKIAKANMSAVKEMLNEINSQFKYFQIRAPFEGIVVNKFIDEGNMANPGTTLLTLENSKRIKVETMVSEQQISNINKGAEVEVLINSINKKLKGKVSEISTSSLHTGGQYLVTVLLDTNNSSILSGMFATVHFPSQSKVNQVSRTFIPEQAIVKRGQLCGVYTISTSNTAILRWLKLGKKHKGNVEVISGLSNGEAYIISSQSKLYNGAKITVQ
jgi:RND family efflux transporter MFP subunit